MNELMTVAEVLALFPGRWKSSGRTLARARIPGRVLLSGNRAAYLRADVEAYMAAEEQRRANRFAAMQARASHAREVMAAKRAAAKHDAECEEIRRLRQIIEAAGLQIPPTG